jgi:hypothetical protein
MEDKTWSATKEFVMSNQEIKASVQAVRSYLEAIGQPIGQVQGYEVVARARGLKSKHVLCAQGASAAQAPARAPTDEDTVSALFEGVEGRLPVSIYVDAFSTTESGEAPQWVRIELDRELFDLLKKGASLSAREELEHVSFDRNPTDWRGGDDRTNWSMFVSARDFWYHGYPKYDDIVETRSIELRKLFDLIRAGQGRTELGDAAWIDGAVYWDGGCNPQALAQSVRYDGSYVENHCPECGEFESECSCSDEGLEAIEPAPATTQALSRMTAHAARALAKYLRESAPDDVRDEGGVDVAHFTVQSEDIEEFPFLQGVQEIRLWDGGIELVFSDGTRQEQPLPEQVLDENVVESLVDDVRERSQEYGFAVTSRAHAMELIAESAQVLGLEPTRKEREAAASKLV